MGAFAEDRGQLFIGRLTRGFLDREAVIFALPQVAESGQLEQDQEHGRRGVQILVHAALHLGSPSPDD